MTVPRIMISDTVIDKLENKHHVEVEEALQGVRNAPEWRKEEGRYHADSRTDSGRKMHIIVERFSDEWQIVTAWWV